MKNYLSFFEKIIRLCGKISINPGSEGPIFFHFKTQFRKEFNRWKEEKYYKDQGCTTGSQESVQWGDCKCDHCGTLKHEFEGR